MHYEISRLRKERGMSQNELARHLQITQSFLSAIENGKSPLPPEKIEKLLEVFNLESLEAYISDDDRGIAVGTRLGEMTDSDLFNQLLQRFHRQAHSKEGTEHHHDHHEQIEEMRARIDSLFKRNERLLERNDRLAEANDRLRNENDALRSEIDSLRKEIFRLKI